MGTNLQDWADGSVDISISRLLQDSNNIHPAPELLVTMHPLLAQVVRLLCHSMWYLVACALPSRALCFVPQVMSSSGPVKVLVVDSVSAVIYPLLGGRQAEGE